jgi:hypothetical protein
MSSYGDFDGDTENWVSLGERPAITGGQWSTARIASAFDVPAYLIWDPPPEREGRNGFYPGDFIRDTIAAAGLWDHDPWPTLTISPNPDGSPTRGIDANAPDPREGHWEDFRCKSTLVPITTTKEQTKMHTLITINATGPHDGNPASATIEVDHDGPSSEPITRAVAAGEEAARALLDGLGLKPWSTKLEPIVTGGPVGVAHDLATAHDPGGYDEATREAEIDLPTDDDPATEDAPNPGAAINRAMYNAIGSEAANIVDVAKELAAGSEGDEGSEGFRERLGVLGKTLSAAADALSQSRMPF